MSEIDIRCKHGRSQAEARHAAEGLAEKLRERLDIRYAWNGDILRFTQAGASGEIAVGDNEIAVRVRLGMLLTAFRPMIEQEIQRVLSKHFPA